MLSAAADLSRTVARVVLTSVIALGLFLCVLPGQAFAAQRVWDGGSTVDGDWTTPENWEGDVAPSPNDDLVFPAGAARLVNTNSFTDFTAFRSITFSGSGYALQGNPLALGVGGVLASHAAGLNVVQLDVLCTGDQALSVQNAGAVVRFSGAVEAGPATLTLDGAGDLEFIADDNSGTVVKNGSGAVSYTGQSPDVHVILNAGTLGGSGAVGTVAEPGGALGPGASPGILTIAGNLTLGAGSVLNFEIWGLTPGTEHDQVRVGGNLTMGNANLNILLGNGFVPEVGDTFTIFQVGGQITGSLAEPDGPNRRVVDGIIYAVTYNRGPNGSVVLQVIGPDPSVDTSDVPLAYVENDGARAVDTGLTVSDVDSTNLSGATVSITGNFTAGQDVLGFTNTATITGSLNGAGDTLTLTGIDSVANYEAALRAVTYTNSSDSPNTASRTISFRVIDTDSNDSATKTRDITITSVNDPPVGANKTVSTPEETPFTFGTADFGFSDPSETPGNAFAAVRITTLPAAGSLANNGVTVTAGQLVAVADIAAGRLQFTPATNANGAGHGTFSFQVRDNGGTANGGLDLDQTARTMTVDVIALNDPPVNAVPGTQATPGNTPLVFTAPGNAISVADADAGGADVQVVLTVPAGQGTLAPGAAGTVPPLTTVSGSGTNTLTLVGSVAEINAALNGLTYTPPSGFSGQVPLTVTTTDLGNSGSGGPLQDPNDTVQITVGILPTVSINDPATVPEGNSGSTNSIAFTVTLSAQSNLQVTVPYTIAGPTATGGAACGAGIDFVPPSGPVIFAPNDTSETIVVPLCGDAVAEGNETFQVTLGTPTNATLADGQGVGTIQDDDGAAGLSIGDATVAEGDAGTATLTFTITLAPPSSQTVTVPFATANGITAPTTGAAACAPNVDYLTATGTLTFQPLDTSETVTVTVCADALVEGSEALLVNLGAPTGGATVADGQGVGTITDDDLAGGVSFGASTASVPESAGTATITVQRTGGAGPAATASTPASSSSTGAPAGTSPGAGIQSGSVVPGGSVRPNPPTSPSPASGPSAPGVGTVSPSALGAVTVQYATADVTATAGQDYLATAGTLTFGVNETSKTITIPILNDSLVEGPEQFTIVLASPTGGASLGQAVITVTIVDTSHGSSPPPGDDSADDERVERERETEEEQRQRARTNRGNKDDDSVEGDVLETRCEDPWPSVVIANHDGAVEVRLIKEAQKACSSMQVGDYLEADGEKQHEHLFHADSVEIKRRR